MYPDSKPSYTEEVARPHLHELAKESKLPVSQQEKALAELHDLISNLTERLEAVLLPDRDEKAEGTVPADRPPMSMLSLQLYGVRSGIERASYRIQRIVERLDV